MEHDDTEDNSTEPTTDHTHSSIETLGDLADALEAQAAWANNRLFDPACDISPERLRGQRTAYLEAEAIAREFRDDLEVDVEEWRDEAENLKAQINDMASTAEMLEQTEQTSTDRELAADAIPDGLRAVFDGLETQRGADGSLNQIEVHVAVGTDQPKNHVVGYHVDGEVARPLDIETPFVEDGVFGLSALAAVPVANKALETHLDSITQTVALPDYTHALYERADDDDTPGLLELGQKHGPVITDQQEVQADGGYVRENDLPSYDITLELVRYRDGDDVKTRWQASADRSETTAADDDPATAVDILLNALEEEAREWVEDDGDEADIRADGGEAEDEYVPVLMVAYERDADLDVDKGGDNPTVTNHDELVDEGQTYDEIRMMKRDSVMKWMNESDIVREGDSLWGDDIAELEPGDSIRLDERGGA